MGGGRDREGGGRGRWGRGAELGGGGNWVLLPPPLPPLLLPPPSLPPPLLLLSSPLHPDVHAVELLHFNNALLVLRLRIHGCCFGTLGQFLCLNIFFAPFAHYVVDGAWVNVVLEGWWVQFFQAIF